MVRLLSTIPEASCKVSNDAGNLFQDFLAFFFAIFMFLTKTIFFQICYFVFVLQVVRSSPSHLCFTYF